MTNTKRAGLLCATALVFIAACGGGGTATPSTAPNATVVPPTTAPTGTGVAPTAPPVVTPAAPTVTPVAPTATAATPLSGEIFISGSSTVGPISAGVKELFNEQNPNVAITVDEPGTGDGFALFCAGETDISDASRKIKDTEATLCADAGIEYVELKVAIDGLSVITSVNNTQVPGDCLSLADLYALIGPEAGPGGYDPDGAAGAATPDPDGFLTWAEAQPLATELGSTTVLPDAPLTITGPGEESGTFDSFVELVITPFAADRGQESTTRPDYVSSGDDNVIVGGVAGTADNTTTLGWVGYAYAQNATDRVKLLSVDDGEAGCIAPTPATIADGSYPIARDLFIYVNKAKAAANPAVIAFVDFYLADGTLDKVLQNPDARYVPLHEDDFAVSVAAWAAR